MPLQKIGLAQPDLAWCGRDEATVSRGVVALVGELQTKTLVLFLPAYLLAHRCCLVQIPCMALAQQTYLPAGKCIICNYTSLQHGENAFEMKRTKCEFAHFLLDNDIEYDLFWVGLSIRPLFDFGKSGNKQLKADVFSKY